MGALGLMLPFSIFTAFSFQYYVYTVGLDSLLTSIGIFLGLFVFAIGSPIFGVISDNKRPGKIGKRRPFLLYGTPILLITAILVWTPPLCPMGKPVYIPTAIYFYVMSILLNLGYVSILAPYNSMLPELCGTEENRVKVASIQGIFNIFGIILGILFPMILQSNLEVPTEAKWWEPSGAYLIGTLPLVGSLLGIVGTILIMISFFSVDESFHEIEVREKTQKISISETFKQMFEPAKNPKLRNYLSQTVYASIAGRILITIVVPLLTYVLLLVGIQFIIFIVVLIPFALLGFIFWNKQIGKIGLIETNVKANYIMIMALLASLSFLVIFDFGIRVVIGIILMGLAISSLVGSFLFPNPIISAIVDESASKLEFTSKLEGISQLSGSYFGLNLFILNFASAIANIVFGALLTGGNEENPFLILISLPIAGLFFIVSTIFLKRIKLEKKTEKY